MRWRNLFPPVFTSGRFFLFLSFIYGTFQCRMAFAYASISSYCDGCNFSRGYFVTAFRNIDRWFYICSWNWRGLRFRHNQFGILDYGRDLGIQNIDIYVSSGSSRLPRIPFGWGTGLWGVGGQTHPHSPCNAIFSRNSWVPRLHRRLFQLPFCRQRHAASKR